MPTRDLIPKYLGGKEKPRPGTRWWDEKGVMVKVVRRSVGTSPPVRERGRVWFIVLPDIGQESSWVPIEDFWAQYTLVSKVTKPTRHLRLLNLHISRADSATLKWTAQTRRMTEQALAEEILTLACLSLRNHLLEKVAE